MKLIFLSTIFILLFLSQLHAQTFALAAPNGCMPAVNTSYYAAYRHNFEYKKKNKTILWGGIIASAGGAASVFGLMWYSWGQGDGEDGPPNTGMINTGKAFAIAGGVLTVTGCVMMIAGYKHDHPKNRWGLVCPKNNELGIAYHF